jgi:hypothetical protein
LLRTIAHAIKCNEFIICPVKVTLAVIVTHRDPKPTLMIRVLVDAMYMPNLTSWKNMGCEDLVCPRLELEYLDRTTFGIHKILAKVQRPRTAYTG